MSNDLEDEEIPEDTPIKLMNENFEIKTLEDKFTSAQSTETPANLNEYETIFDI